MGDPLECSSRGQGSLQQPTAAIAWYKYGVWALLGCTHIPALSGGITWSLTFGVKTCPDAAGFGQPPIRRKLLPA